MLHVRLAARHSLRGRTCFASVRHKQENTGSHCRLRGLYDPLCAARAQYIYMQEWKYIVTNLPPPRCPFTGALLLLMALQPNANIHIYPSTHPPTHPSIHPSVHPSNPYLRTYIHTYMHTIRVEPVTSSPASLCGCGQPTSIPPPPRPCHSLCMSTCSLLPRSGNPKPWSHAPIHIFYTYYIARAHRKMYVNA